MRINTLKNTLSMVFAKLPWVSQQSLAIKIHLQNPMAKIQLDTELLRRCARAEASA
jgi:hypothetical protein